MSDSNKRPLKTGPWYLVVHLSLWVFLALATHILLASHYWEDKEAHLQKILENDLSQIESLSTSESSFNFVKKGAALGYDIIFEKSGFNEMIRVFSTPVNLNPFDTEMRKLVVYFWPEIKASMFSIQIIGERLAVLILTLPLFIVAFLIAASDGWVGRWLRRAYGGRESAFLYHRLKRGVFLSLVLLWASYLMLPYSFDPRILIFSFVLLFGVLLRYTVSYFKKYF
jgi:integrating conjugative element membrane protein (TIGR03747 family)